jgi:hypothetical protein
MVGFLKFKGVPESVEVEISTLSGPENLGIVQSLRSRNLTGEHEEVANVATGMQNAAGVRCGICAEWSVVEPWGFDHLQNHLQHCRRKTRNRV